MEILSDAAWQGIGAIIAIISLVITVYDRKTRPQKKKDYFYIARAAGFFVMGTTYGLILMGFGLLVGFVLDSLECPPLAGSIGNLAFSLSTVHVGYWGFGDMPMLPRQLGALGLWMGMSLFGSYAVLLGTEGEFRLDKIDRDYLVIPLVALFTTVFVAVKVILLDLT